MPVMQNYFQHDEMACNECMINIVHNIRRSKRNDFLDTSEVSVEL